jgi:hypothetical protein
MRSKPRLAVCLSVVACLAAGCGPVAIGAGIASAGGGGTRTIDEPSINALPPSQQIAEQELDAQTTLRWTAVQNQSRNVFFFVEVLQAGSTTRIPHEHLQFGAEFAREADNAFVGPASAAGVPHRAVWNHGAQLGQTEVRDVTVQVVYRDALRPESTLKTTVVFAPSTIGREIGTLGNTRITRQSDAESALIVTCDYTDRGEDLARASFQLEYAVARNGQGEPDWQVLDPAPAWSPVQNSRRTEADGRITHEVMCSVDPIARNMAPGNYDANNPLFVRVRHRETFDRFPPAPPLTPVRESAWVPSTHQLQIGNPPTILRVSIPDPERRIGNQRPQGRPWFLLPITLEVASTSRTARRVIFDVRAAVDAPVNDEYPITFARENEAATAREIDLPASGSAGATRVHYLIWNVIADEGLGIRRNITAQVKVTAALKDARVPSAQWRGGNQATSGTTRLSTNPFVEFGLEELEPDAVGAASGVIARTSRTRDIFYRRQPAVEDQVYRIGVNQEFSPIRIPGLLEYDIRNAPGHNRTDGANAAYPTDFAPGPDCLVRTGNTQYFLAWPTTGNSGPIVEPVPTDGGGHAFGGDAFDFESRLSPTRTVPTFFFYSHAVTGNGPPGQVVLKAVAYDRDTRTWLTPTFRDETFPIPTGSNLTYRIANGNFDADLDTTEIAIANVGVEKRLSAGPQGWMHRVRMTPNAQTGITFEAPEPLTIPRDPDPVDLDRFATWLLTALPQVAADGRRSARDALLLARTFYYPNNSGGERRVVFHTLTQDPGNAQGGFAGRDWQPLTVLETNTVRGFSFGNVFAADLDGNLGGTQDPELVALFGGNNVLDVWLYARTRRGFEWRKSLEDVAVPATRMGQQFFMDSSLLADLNGDEYLDLALRVGDRSQTWNSGFYYIASALTGVAGELGEVPEFAGGERSFRPGVADFDRDGYPDLLANGFFYKGIVTGAFENARSGYRGRERADYAVQQVFDVGVDRSPSHDFFVRDPDAFGFATAFVQKVDVVRENGILQPRPGIAYPVEVGGSVAALAPFVVPGRTAAKDLAVLVTTTNPLQARLWRAQLAGQSFVGTLRSDLPSDLLPELATLRKGSLVDGADATRNTLQQDVVVARSDSNEIVVLRADDNYTTPMPVVAAPAAERIRRLASASVTEDRLEDVLVLTEQTTTSPPALRLRYLAQRADGSLDNDPDQLLLQFDDWGLASLHGFGFHSGATRLANGILIFEQGVKFVVPEAARPTEALSFRPTMIQSTFPAGRGPLSAFGVQLTDFDGDGQVEVVGGSVLIENVLSLRQVDRAYRNN